MARVHHQNDDDDFMDPPQQNRATGRRKEGDEKKKRTRNRASQERLTTLTDRLTDDQKGVAAEMGMQALMNVRCTNLVNPVCDWLGEIYDPASREFVIPGHGRLPLNKESVFCTLGVPRGHIKVPYEVNNEIEEALFPRLFPGLESMPNTSVLADSLQAMTTHGDVFKMKLLMYLISVVFAPTTSLHPSNKCFPVLAKLKDVKNMNWCKFIADFLHDAFSSKMYQKGCRLHLMLMYVDCLDLSIVDFTGTGGPPPTHKFVVSAWTINAVKVVLAADRARAPVEHLIGQFASGMTGLLGKLVEGWTSLSGSDSDTVARQFTSFVPERTHWPTGCRGRYDYNSSQELADTQDELDGDASLSKDDDDDMENVKQDTDDDEHAEVRAGAPIAGDTPSTRSSPCTTTSNTGDPIVLPDLRKPVKKTKKTTTREAKHIGRDPLERLHSKLLTGGNSDVHEAPGDKTAAAPPIVPTNSNANGRPSPTVADVEVRTTGIRTSRSDESVSARTAEILPTLLAMKDAAVSHATPSASVEVDAPETNLSKEDSRSSDTDSKRVRGGTHVPTTEVAEAAVHNDMPSIGESLGTTAPAPVGADTAKVTVSRVGLPPRRRSPRKQSTDIPNAPVVARSSREESGYVPASTLFPPVAKSNVMEKPEDQSTTDAGALPGSQSIRHERHPMAFTPPSFSLGISQDQTVVQDPMPVAFAFLGGMPAMMAQPMVEGRKVVKFVEPIVQGTPEDISPSLDEAYRGIEEAALQRRSSRGQGQSSSNVPADTVSEDTIRSATPGSVRQQRVVHPPPAKDYEPEFRATKELTQLYDIVKRFGNVRASNKHMKELKATKVIQCEVTYVDLGDLAESVMFPMFQELAPHDPHDKCGHHYAICFDLKNQRFEVLDSMHSAADADLTSHAEFFINNVKDTWNRHYENSKVQIRHFPIEYVATTNQGNTTDCGFHTLEYFAKWEGRLVPAVTAATVVELRKIYTWNWLTNEDFNKRSRACEFMEEAVKKVIKKYK
ncbi:hypothetical protein VPH35_074384 [Triticum aestivum]|uniref:Ubiquitin-like protease family profile domain-containing protein n=1 Tax=Triticum aestivum TaxID=4565 RepID=A0A3B6IWE2_WHEAT